ncbi:SDR family NAD(P)-dependent oxidoreductase [Neoactinobaculum massilliense]|uniref:SDR family NAD(P)-dependent oxidoreductase n=1 Tax=Neoactinobaculum massilliense TaxID=2364794 RepID=UPI000F528E49|nr:SDR family oxidoreductase [Neoactinobaculum massilliense]
MGSALITGASSGIGKEFAWQLAAERNDLVLVARGRERLEKLAEQIRQVAGVQVEVLVADLSDADATARVAERLRSTTRPIGLLVNNAGFGLGQEFVGGSLKRDEEALNVMVRAVMVLCHAAAPVMKARGYGGIINVASMTALTAQGPYSAHKAWVKTFTEGLAAELAGTGVSVTAVLPGLTRTEFHARSGVDSSQWPSFEIDSPVTVANAAIDACRHHRVLVIPSPLYRAAAVALKWAPRWLVRKVTGPGLSGRSIVSPETAGIKGA